MLWHIIKGVFPDSGQAINLDYKDVLEYQFETYNAK
jgi:hypothetical protein